MYSKIISGGVMGVEGVLIQVETDINPGLPMFNMVGYLSSCVREAAERVRTALKNSNFSLPPQRVTINLSPADIRKEGTAFDLPIAIGILVAMGIIPQDSVKDIIILGELSLDGHVNSVSGVLSVIHHAFKQGIRKCIVPKQNAKEAALISEMEVIPVDNLIEAENYLNKVITIEPEYIDIKALFNENHTNKYGDFSDIKGQVVLKRGMEIAAAGMHNILMTGAAGSGKSMIAKRLPTILPELTFEESIEITKIYSVAGLLKSQQSVVKERPFRSPHHTISTVALSGGGREPRPGEISLAHNGVLFLDELPEFNRNVLEVMRQPLEDKEVTISRINGIYRFPAGFMLVAARNTCPCGQYPDMNKCTCSFRQIKQYNSRISRPLLDRIDINVEVNRVAYKDLYESEEVETSRDIRKRVYKAQAIQADRYKSEKINFNSQLDGHLTSRYISLGAAEKKFLEETFEQTELSARGSNRVLKIARTIADLDGSEQVNIRHLKEAVFYRNVS
jgi:magnesium chelatase family protein